MYKMLENNSIWIDISTATFDSHIVPFLSYGEYSNILNKSMFKCVEEKSSIEEWYPEEGKIMT